MYLKLSLNKHSTNSNLEAIKCPLIEKALEVVVSLPSSFKGHASNLNQTNPYDTLSYKIIINYLKWFKLQPVSRDLWIKSNPSELTPIKVLWSMLLKNFSAKDCICHTKVLSFPDVWTSKSSWSNTPTKVAKRTWKCEISAVGSESIFETEMRFTRLSKYQIMYQLVLPLRLKWEEASVTEETMLDVMLDSIELLQPLIVLSYIVLVAACAGI